MPRRPSFRPSISDRLEERVVLSRLTPSAMVRTRIATVPTSSFKIGAMGDSVTDEYRFATPSRGTAKNWVEILGATRHLRFGTFSNASRGEPRNAGYANNWARSDATSDDMVSKQLPGLSQQVRRGQVNLVWIFIGGNDFLKYATKFSPLSPPSTAEVTAGLAKVESRAEDNLTTAVRTLMAANPNVKITLATVPDLRQLPAVATVSANPLLKPLVDAVSGSVDQYNAHIRALAAEDPAHIAIVDLNAMYASLARSAAATGKINVGNQSIDVRTPGDDPTHLFLSDGVHVGTVAQGLIANQFVKTLDTSFQGRIPILRSAEILRQAKVR